MSSKPISFMVSTHVNCNDATNSHHTVNDEILNPPTGLLGSASRVVEHHKIKKTKCFDAPAKVVNCEVLTSLGGLLSSAAKIVECNRVIRSTYLEASQVEKSPITTSLVKIINQESSQSCIDAFRIGHNHATNVECAACGYRGAFCTCKTAFPPDMVVCITCEHFIPDKIGDGTGIGDCGLGIKWTKEYNGRRPLYPYSERHCKDFSKLMS